jgi:hypothetical protein
VPFVGVKVFVESIMLAGAQRRILHLIMTEHPTARLTAQQFVEAFACETWPA